MEVVKDALVNAPNLNMQIAALYLYYSLYNKQPLRHFVKIRLTLSDIDKLIQQFFPLLQSRAQYQQPLLIFRKLWEQCSFHFVAESHEILKILHRKPTYSVQTTTTSIQVDDFEPLNLRVEMEDVFDEDEGIIARLSMLELAYNEMKEELGRGDPTIVPSRVCETITSHIDNIGRLLNTNAIFPEEEKRKKLTRRDQVLEKISAIQRTKNTLPEEDQKAGPSKKRPRERSYPGKEVNVVVEDEENISIDTSFMSVPQQRYSSISERVLGVDNKKKRPEEVKKAVTVNKGKKKRAGRRK